MTPPRVVRRRRTGLIAALAAVLFLAGLLGVERRDDAWLLQVAGRSMDARGFLWVAWQNAWRGCAPLKRLQPHDPQVLPALEALREFSPPDSRSAVVLQADAWPGAGTARGRVEQQHPALELGLARAYLPGGAGHASPVRPDPLRRSAAPVLPAAPFTRVGTGRRRP